ncbi:hypothetical protein HY948_00030 [Candidatus Gottesmanbacteria bacterium]|nr:hypothetical protein [Candidatus Gottesmanbacteria bacterium]
MPTIYRAPVKKAKSNMKPLSYFAVNPDGVRFETQEAREEVVLFLRQHPIVNVTWIVIAVIMFFAPTILFPFVLSFLPVAGSLPAGYMIVGTVFWYVATFGFILGNFLYWFFNIYIVTNERVVDIDFLYLLYKRFSQAELSKIQDISYASGGILAAVFDYGNVIIETAGEAPNLEFGKVPHPEKVVETIRSLTGLGTK